MVKFWYVMVLAGTLCCSPVIAHDKAPDQADRIDKSAAAPGEHQLNEYDTIVLQGYYQRNVPADKRTVQEAIRIRTLVIQALQEVKGLLPAVLQLSITQQEQAELLQIYIDQLEIALKNPSLTQQEFFSLIIAVYCSSPIVQRIQEEIFANQQYCALSEIIAHMVEQQLIMKNSRDFSYEEIQEALKRIQVLKSFVLAHDVLAILHIKKNIPLALCKQCLTLLMRSIAAENKLHEFERSSTKYKQQKARLENMLSQISSNFHMLRETLRQRFTKPMNTLQQLWEQHRRA